MREFLYIGQNTPGTTSAMRFNSLCKILDDWNCSVIDTNEEFLNRSRLIRSITFRFKRGPVITAINQKIIGGTDGHQYDLVWIDKGIYVQKKTLDILRRCAHKLVHYTPDPAFLFHKSHLFKSGVKCYDFLITTKSYELDIYCKYVPKEKVILTTQGFDKNVHKSYHRFSEKEGVVMIGHYESDRGEVVQMLLDQGMMVKVAGIGWENFVKRNFSNSKLVYLAKGVFGKEYAQTISSSLFGLGLLSKLVPEQHTTRTFEIPACATALVTEANAEIRTFYAEDEVIYFKSHDELVQRIKFLEQRKDELAALTERGYKKVVEHGYDYDSILRNIISKIM